MTTTSVAPSARWPLAALSNGRRRRRVWSSPGRAHIEIRGGRRAGADGFTRHLLHALESLDPVQWAEVNAVTGRVVVAFDPDGADLDDLLDAVEGVEKAHDLHNERFSHERPEHPGDVEPLRRNAIALGADLFGLGVSTFGQLLSLTPLPTELAALVSLAESEPRIRRFLDHHLGPAASEVGLGVANAFGQAFSQGPTGLLVDMVNRGTVIGELRSQRELWRAREPALAVRRHGVLGPIRREPRPIPLPRGPIERYTDRASMATLAAFGVTLAATGRPRLAASAFVAGVPKAARLGREAFAAQTGRMLADRGVLVMDRTALRRLDRVDTVLLDADVLRTGSSSIASIETVGGRRSDGRAPGPDTDLRTITSRIESLFDARDPLASRRRGRWHLAPFGRPGTTAERGVASRARQLSREGAGVLALSRQDHVVALAAVQADLDPSVPALIAASRRSGLAVLVAGGNRSVRHQLGVEGTPGGQRLRRAVRALQAGGGVVLLISGSAGRGALAAADCGFGVARTGVEPPWDAHLLGGDDLRPALYLIEAVRAARSVSRNSAGLSLAGSGIGAAWAVAGLPASAARRASLPVNVTAFVAQASSTVAARAAGRRTVSLPPRPEPWHELTPAEVVDALDSSPDGLSTGEAERRFEPPHPHRSAMSRLGHAVVAELANPITPLLAVGAGLSAAVGSVTDAVLVTGVTGVNAAIGAAQRLRAEVSLERLADASAGVVGVRRDGTRQEVRQERVVRGDVLELRAGDQVPADCRILEACSCEVDESSLTGESLPVTKHATATPGVAVADRHCMLYEGTTMVTGSALAVVVAVGSATEARRGLADAPEPPPSGVEARLTTLTGLTVPVTVASGAAVTGLGIARGVTPRRAISSGVGLMVAAVPEGLPLLASGAQLAAARRLATRDALVRNPRTIEALGRIDTLCFDKTGTLTAGHIAVQRVSDGVTDEPTDALGERGRAVLCTALRASPPDDGDEVLRHATDRAVVDGAQSAGVDRDGWTQGSELAFESNRAFHAVVGTGRDGPSVAAKGAPEVILPRCTTWRGPSGAVPVTRRVLRTLEGEVERLARRGLRVLAVAERPARDGGLLVDARVSDLELLGFVVLADHVRPTAAAAVTDLGRAGVRVAMITGDHPSTARAVAEELGILGSRPVLTGPDIDAMSDAALEVAADATSVFARVTPAHKVRIVGALQRAGRVVAMTGDGANDAPAIRLADVGIALGRRGAPAAREAADLVVLDDRIETLVDAIVEGRAMWASVRDALAILIGGNMGEVAFSIATAAVTGSTALGARQFLLVNLLTDLAPAMAIALRPPAGRSPASLLHEGPDASLGGSLTAQIALRAATTAGGATGAWLVARATGRRRRASTIALAALVGTQLTQTMVAGSHSPLVIATALGSGAVLVAAVQTPGVSQFFGCTPLGPVAWAIAGAATGIATAGSIVVPSVVTRVSSSWHTPLPANQANPAVSAPPRLLPG